jgi:hypothetical protein
VCEERRAAVILILLAAAIERKDVKGSYPNVGHNTVAQIGSIHKRSPLFVANA